MRTPTETKVYFWSPAQAKVSFSRKAEAQSANRDRTGNAVHFVFPVELSFLKQEGGT